PRPRAAWSRTIGPPLGLWAVRAPMPGATSTGQDVARRLTDDGYVVVSGLLPPPDVPAAAAGLGGVVEAVPTGRNPFEGLSTQRVYALFAKTRTFDRAVVHPLVLEVLDQVLGHYQLSARWASASGRGSAPRCCTATTRSTRCRSR